MSVLIQFAKQPMSTAMIVWLLSGIVVTMLRSHRAPGFFLRRTDARTLCCIRVKLVNSYVLISVLDKTRSHHFAVEEINSQTLFALSLIGIMNG